MSGVRFPVASPAIFSPVRKATDRYSTLSDDEIDRWLSYYSTSKGHIDLYKIGPVSSIPDWLFVGAIVLLALLNFGIFEGALLLNMLGSVAHWGSHFAFSAALLFITSCLGLIVIGERVSNIAKFYALKRIKAQRAKPAFAS